MTNRVRIALLISTILLAGVVLLCASCAPTAPAKTEKTVPTVSVIPNVGKVGEKVNYVGANFELGEEVIIAMLVAPGIVNTLYRPTDPSKLSLKVDEIGSFKVNNKIPLGLSPGVYPVRVYDENWEILASTLILIEE